MIYFYDFEKKETTFIEKFQTKNKYTCPTECIIMSRAVVEGQNLKHLLPLNILDFPLMLEINFLLLIEFTNKVTSLLQAWRTRLQVTENIMTAPTSISTVEIFAPSHLISQFWTLGPHFAKLNFCKLEIFFVNVGCCKHSM